MNIDARDMAKIPADAFAVEEKPAAAPAINQAEFEAAEAEAKEPQADVSIYTHKFKKPVTIEGCTIEELTFDFGRLTGADSLAIEDELQALNKPVIVPTFSGQYLTRVAARACTTTLSSLDGKSRRVGADTIMALPISDYNRIRSRARTFLLASER